MKMIGLIFSTILLLPDVHAGGYCTKFANTINNYTYFCSGHCCGTPVGDECCFDGIAQTFTVIACVIVFCLLLFGVAYFVIGRWTQREPKGRIKPQEDPAHLDSGEPSQDSKPSDAVPRQKHSVSQPEDSDLGLESVGPETTI